MFKELKINNQIRAKEVRLIGESGEQFGIILTSQAFQNARDSGLDLVEVSPTAVPPVCKIMNYGKYRYELEKKDRKARKSQKSSLLKEMRLRPRIKEHDLDAKINSIRKFILDGDKVRVHLQMRGREASHPELGWKIIKKVVDDLRGTGVLDSPPAVDNNSMVITFSPSAKKEIKTGQVKENAEIKNT